MTPIAIAPILSPQAIVELPCTPEEVALWRIDLAAFDAQVGERLLSEHEIRRAARFAFARDRRRFIASRAALREILGRLTGIAPERLTIGEGEHGKPFLENSTRLHFNLSHSGEVALIATGGRREVGIDIEECATGTDAAEVAPSVFTDRELTEIAAVPEEARPSAFYRCWTRKEAALKAEGSGLAIEARGVYVGTFAQEARVTLNGRDFLVRDLQIEAAYSAAVAVEH
jgi:4'-phosphopantetheinyl transferase